MADPDDLDVQTMSRSSSPSELLYGPLQFTLFMMYCGTTKFMTIEGTIVTNLYFILLLKQIFSGDEMKQ